MKHVWEKDEKGKNTYHEFGDRHGGPRCVLCGYIYCTHCDPAGPPEPECEVVDPRDYVDAAALPLKEDAEQWTPYMARVRKWAKEHRGELTAEDLEELCRLSRREGFLNGAAILFHELGNQPPALKSMTHAETEAWVGRMFERISWMMNHLKNTREPFLYPDDVDAAFPMPGTEKPRTLPTTFDKIPLGATFKLEVPADSAFFEVLFRKDSADAYSDVSGNSQWRAGGPITSAVQLCVER